MQEEVRALQDRVNMLDSQVAQLHHSHSTVSSQVEVIALDLIHVVSRLGHRCAYMS